MLMADQVCSSPPPRGRITPQLSTSLGEVQSGWDGETATRLLSPFMGARDPGVNEDGFPADQFVKGWAGRGEDMEICHGDPTKTPKMHRTSHRATGMQIQAKRQRPESGGRKRSSPWGTGQGWISAPLRRHRKPEWGERNTQLRGHVHGAHLGCPAHQGKEHEAKICRAQGSGVRCWALLVTHMWSGKSRDLPGVSHWSEAIKGIQHSSAWPSRSRSVGPTQCSWSSFLPHVSDSVPSIPEKGPGPLHPLMAPYLKGFSIWINSLTIPQPQPSSAVRLPAAPSPPSSSEAPPYSPYPGLSLHFSGLLN